jgi:hypothetical protein
MFQREIPQNTTIQARFWAKLGPDLSVTLFCAIFFPTTHKTFYCSDMLKHVSENFQKISLSFLYPRFNNSRLRYESYKKHFVARTSLGHDDFARSAMKE